MKKKITLENILCLFIILCPVFDIASFLFRNYFNTNTSVSTFLRPLIPIIAGIYIFIKAPNKNKQKLVLIGVIYAFYAIIHLYTMKTLITGCSYGNVMNELQYVFNFTFLMIDLVIYEITFKKGNMDKLKKSIAIMLAIYIGSIYISIITKTSSSTYITGTGYKGWIESGNSLSAILVMSLCIVLTQIKPIKSDKKDLKWQIFIIVEVILTAIYLTTLIGTRVGLIGTFLVVGLWIVFEVIFSKNKRLLIIGLISLVIAGTIIGFVGSKTLQRRKQMNEAKNTIIDESTGEVGNMTGDMLKLKNQIQNGTLQQGYMSEAQAESVIDLFNYAKEHSLAGNDTRTQQLMYNIYLVKNQKNILAIFFGNGYKTNFREMVMENELASMILNFGIFGFILYIGPFLAILIYSIIEVIKNKKILDAEYMMYQLGIMLSFILSWLSGYVFFASSSMVIITTLGILLLSKSRESKEVIK